MGDPPDLHTFDPAAVAAVIALRAIVAESADIPVDHVRVLPSQQVVTDSEAASILAELPKPIHCIPSANGGVLEIRCEPVEPRIAPVHQTIREPSAGGEWDGSPEEARRVRDAAHGDVLVIGRGTEAVTLSPADFQRFEEEYSLGASHFQIGDVPEFFGFPRGAATARRYGHRIAVRRSTSTGSVRRLLGMGRLCPWRDKGEGEDVALAWRPVTG
jgi:hypothetical protein